MKHILIFLTIILLSGNITLPAQPANQDEGFLIMFEPDVKAEDVLSKNLFLQDGELIIVEHFEYVNIWWVQHRSQKITREAALQRLKSEPGIRYAEPIRNQVTLRGSIPNDPLFSDQWGMNNTGQSGGTSGADISAARAWQITRGDSWGTHVPVVAVIDDGLNGFLITQAEFMFDNKSSDNLTGINGPSSHTGGKLFDINTDHPIPRQ